MNLGPPDSKLNDFNGSSTMYQRTSNFLLPMVSMFADMHGIRCISIRKNTLQLQARLTFFSIQTSDLFDNVALMTTSGDWKCIIFPTEIIPKSLEKTIGVLCFMERQYDIIKIL